MSSPAKSLESSLAGREVGTATRVQYVSTQRRALDSPASLELRIELKLGHRGWLQMTAIGLEDDEDLVALRSALRSKEQVALEACLPITVREAPGPADERLVEILGTDLILRSRGWPSVALAIYVPVQIWHEALDDLLEKINEKVNEEL